MNKNKENAHRPYVIYTTGFDEKIGGVIALHHLCDLLNSVGEKAYLWPTERFVHREGWFANSKFFWKVMFKKILRIKFKKFYKFNTPIATKKILCDAIVIYPEIVDGNPLGAKHIVRWFLNKPGYFTGKVEYGENELYYFYAEHFNDSNINVNGDHFLKTLFLRDDIYHEALDIEKKGSCYILRKGKGRKLVHDLTDSILIDGLSHERIAKIFNKSEFCISYDTHTMLSKYAAMSGCVSIVIPREGVSKEQWRPNINDRLGIAYGFDDIQWAKDTMGKVLQNFREQQSRTLVQLEAFIEKTQAKFPDNKIY